MLKKSLSEFAILLFLFVSASSSHADTPLESCGAYEKYGVPGQNGTLLCRKGYFLAHDSELKTPIWVVERLTREKANGPFSRSNNFRADSDLNVGERAELSDYRKSGFDRGHMAPAGNLKWDQQAMSESFFLSNIIPQVGEGMNRGIWKNLEVMVRRWVINRGEVYIYTGPIYAKAPPDTIGTNKVAVPTHLYKIIYDPVTVEAIAFIMPNIKLKGADISTYIVTIREVEEKTGLNFLSKLNPMIEDIVETNTAIKLWAE
jgi:endonuclease G